MVNEIKSEDISKDLHQLSDLLDDCGSSEAVDELLASPSQQETWYRYHAIRSVLKREYSAFSSYDFTRNISAIIAEEPAIVARPSQNDKVQHSARIYQFWKRAGGGLAIAASVAYAMVFSVQMMNSNPQSGQGVETAAVQMKPAAELVSMSAADVEEQARLDAIQSLLDTVSKTRLNAYEQQVGGEWIFSKEVKLDPLQELERQVDGMKKPSEVKSEEDSAKHQ